MKFGQLAEYNKGNIFLQKSCIKWGREISSRPLFVFLKSFTWGKSKLPATCFHYISIVHKLAYNINKLCKTLSYWSGDIFHFDFLEKCLGIVSPPHLVCYFWTKSFSCCILLTDQVSLPDCLYFLKYWAICVLQLLVNQAVTS